MRIYKCDRCLKEMTTIEINNSRPIAAPNLAIHEFCKSCEDLYFEAYAEFHRIFMETK